MRIQIKNENGDFICLGGSVQDDYGMFQCDIGTATEDSYTLKTPLSDGAFYTGCSLGSRDILIGGVIRGDRTRLVRALNPRYRAVMEISDGKVTRYLNGKVFGGVQIATGTPKTFAFTFRAFDPFFYEDPVTVVLPANQTIPIWNNGDLPTWFSAEFSFAASDLGTTPFRLYNQTANEEIKLKDRIHSSVLSNVTAVYLNTSPQKRLVRYQLAAVDEFNGYEFLDGSSVLFSLAPGKNLISCNYPGKLIFSARYLDWR